MNGMSEEDEFKFAALQGVAINKSYDIETRHQALCQAFEMLSEHVDKLTESFKKFEEASNMENFKKNIGEVTRVFTFGAGHLKYARRFVEITAESHIHCRMIMLNHFGGDWAFDYESREKAGIYKYKLVELPKHVWPKSTNHWKINEEGNLVENI